MDSARDLLHASTIKALCARAGIRPDRKSGQNFLVNRTTLDRIVAAVEPRAGDTILEVGAGFGALTLALALAERMVADVPPLRVRGGEGELRTVRNPSQPPLTLRGGDAGRIIAIERDRRIVPILRENVMRYGNVEVVEGDVLRMLRAAEQQSSGAAGQGGSRAAEPSQLQQGTAALRLCCTAAKWKLAANLPYSITSDFLRLLFDAVGTGAIPSPERVVLLLQREVVDRLVADPSQPSDRRAVGLLTILTQLHCAPRRIARVPAAHFWPVPKVESAVVALESWRTPEEIEMLLHGDDPRAQRETSARVEGLRPTLREERASDLRGGRGPAGEPGGSARAQFLRLVRTAFGKRRGQLQRTLRSVTRDPSAAPRSRAKLHYGAALRIARIDPTARPEELTFQQWVALARVLQLHAGPSR